MAEKLRLNINGIEVTAFPGQTVLEVAKENGIEIPTLCYDKRVKVYGACGLCVVEMEGSPKLFRAWATSGAECMVIKTETPQVKESRKASLELLLRSGTCGTGSHRNEGHALPGSPQSKHQRFLQ